jgi:hypothetical protein
MKQGGGQGERTALKCDQLICGIKTKKTRKTARKLDLLINSSGLKKRFPHPGHRRYLEPPLVLPLVELVVLVVLVVEVLVLVELVPLLPTRLVSER